MELRFARNRTLVALGAMGALGLAVFGTGGCSSDDTSTPVTPSTTTGTDGGTTTTGDASTGTSCASPKTTCSGSCVDTATDVSNCGACGKACVAGQVCSSGTCALACAGGATKCDTACVDTKVDPNNCGACGTKCGAGEVCSNGQCGLTCASPLTKCGASADAGVTQAFCANTQNDNDNCGACGTKCTGNKRCLAGACVDSCTTGADCGSGAAACTAGKCAVPADCSEIKLQNPSARSGQYTIDPDGNGALAPFTAWCDMVTDGGGWTIITSMTGADNEQGFTGDTEANVGDPMAWQRVNLNRAKKMALSAISKESIFVRKDGRWLKADKPMFDGTLGTANKDAAFAVKLNAMNGQTVDAFMGWSNFDILGGGDFGISRNPDGVGSCGGAATVNGFDHHSTAYRQLNCNCDRQYLYSYSAGNGVNDSDAAYNVNTGLGAWTATQTCNGNEGSGVALYAAMRRPLTDYASCKALKTALPNTPSGWQIIDIDGAGAKAPIGVYCDMVTDGGGYTQFPVTGSAKSSSKKADPDTCKDYGLNIGVLRTLAHQQSSVARYGIGYFQTVPGVTGVAAGNYTTCAMNSTDATCAANWKAIDNGAWFARAVPYGEPNGDYDAANQCWLGSNNNSDFNGFLFNDGNCGYATGANYVCSDNAK